MMAVPEDRRRSSSTWASARRRRTRRSSTPAPTSSRKITGQKPAIAPRQEVDRAVQGAQGHADRRDGHAARRADVRVPRPPDVASRCRASATSAACRRRASTAAATTRSACSDQLLFPEIDYMKVDKARGMNVSVVTTAQDRRRSAQAAAVDRHAVPAELAGTERLWRRPQRSRRDAETPKFEVRHAQPLPPVRPPARVHAQVRAVPPVLPRARARRRRRGRHRRAAGSERSANAVKLKGS